MADYINNVAAGDGYTPACTLGPDFQTRSAVITIANNPALMQFAVGVPGNWRWTDEREFFSIPQSFKVGGVVGLKVRNANPGQVARVLAVLSGPDDVEFEAGLPFTGALSASGTVTPPGTGIMQLIGEIDLTIAGAGYSQFSAIPSTFKHLCLMIYARSTTAGLVDTIAMIFNADTTNLYEWQLTQTNAAALAAADGAGLVGTARAGQYPGAAAVANMFGVVIIDIPYYQGVGFKAGVAKSVRPAANAAGGVFGEDDYFTYEAVAAISSIGIKSGAGASFAPGSLASLYGLA